MSATGTAPRTDRLEARIPKELKAILMKAASLQGRSLTDFVIASASDVARQVIRESGMLDLSERDQLAFAEALINPPAPNPALIEAARRYRGEPA